jgi:hypothetical protein
VSTFSEFREQAEQDIRAHIQSTSPDYTHPFVMDSTNYLAEHGAALLGALRLWAEHRHMRDADLRALLDLANAMTLENIANQLAKSRDPEELLASVQLQGVAFAPPHQLHDTLEFARKDLQQS